MIHHQIADAQIAVKHHERRGRRQVGAQPRKTQRDGRPISARFGKLRGERFHARCRLEHRQEGESAGSSA